MDFFIRGVRDCGLVVSEYFCRSRVAIAVRASLAMMKSVGKPVKSLRIKVRKGF